MSYRLYLRGEDRRRIGEIDDFVSLKYVRKHAGIGSWLLTLDGQARLPAPLTPGLGLIIERNGEVVLSGPLTGINTSDDESGRVQEVRGFDDSVILSQRLAYPAPFFNLAAYDVRSGPIETVVKGYLDFNAGPGSSVHPDPRQVAGLVIAADQGRGANVQVQARFDRLDELTDGLVGISDLGYFVRQYVPGYDPTVLVFDVVAPRNKTATVHFSREFGNLPSYVFDYGAPPFTQVLIAGQGEGADRRFLGAGNTTVEADWGRIEGELVDRRDTDEDDQLFTELSERLTETVPSTSLSITVQDTALLRYGMDWDIGDRVTVSVEGIRLTDIVREVTITLSENEESIEAVIGSPEALSKGVLGIYNAQRKLALRTSQLERRP